MLKFQRIRTKPELIRIFLDSSLWATKEATVAHSNQKTRTNIKRHFGQKYPELLPENWKLNGNIFFKLCLSYLDVKMTSAGYKRERNKKHSETCEEPMIYSSWRSSRTSWKSLLVNNFSLRSQHLVPSYSLYILTNVQTSISERFGPKFEQINISPTATLQKRFWVGWGDWRKELKDVLQLANDEIIPLSKFGANRK